MRPQFLSLARRILRKRGMPVQLIHFVTARCNARCAHCFYWKKLNAGADELSVDEVRRVARSIGKFFFLIATGGEPFLREDFVDLIDAYYTESGIRSLNVPTNGILVEKIRADSEMILARCPGLSFNITLSLDGIGADHDRIRGVDGCFAKAVETYWKLFELKKRYPRFDLTVVTTMNRLNQDKMRDIYSFVRDVLKADIYTVNLVRGDAKAPSMKEVDVDRYRAINERILSEYKYKRNKVVYRNLSDFKRHLRCRVNALRYRAIADTLERGEYISPCYAGLLDGVMYESGDVFPCELLDAKLGNVREAGYDFPKIWYSPRADEVRERIRRERCFCTHECNWRNNILFNPAYLMRLVV
jgi:MoaA/NifB/PqqE/SkfB family radical SAM enzyme